MKNSRKELISTLDLKIHFEVNMYSEILMLLSLDIVAFLTGNIRLLFLASKCYNKKILREVIVQVLFFIIEHLSLIEVSIHGEWVKNYKDETKIVACRYCKR